MKLSSIDRAKIQKHKQTTVPVLCFDSQLTSTYTSFTQTLWPLVFLRQFRQFEQWTIKMTPTFPFDNSNNSLCLRSLYLATRRISILRDPWRDAPQESKLILSLPRTRYRLWNTSYLALQFHFVDPFETKDFFTRPKIHELKFFFVCEILNRSYLRS